MSESEAHQHLTGALVTWIAGTYLRGDDGSLLVDGPLAGLRGGPPMVGGFRPDVYLAPSQKNVLVIGEAETARELERPHTTAQLGTFLEYCCCYRGSALVLAVPWYMTRCAKSLLRYLQERHRADSVTAIVLDKLEG